jgi:hypothetical protein
MRKKERYTSAVMCSCLLFWLASVSGVGGADSFVWNNQTDRVTADVRGMSVTNLLERVARETGWQVFLEPGIPHQASTRFKDISSGDALRKLLGDLNFALIPQTNSASHLYVFRTAIGRATQRILPLQKGAAASGAKRVSNELIVRLKPGADINEIARALGAKVIGQIPELNAYRLLFEDAAAAEAALSQLATNPDVASADYNYYVDRPSVPQGISSVSASLPQLQVQPQSGCGNIVVGIVDTAVQPLGNNLEEFIAKRISVAGEASVDQTTPTHGTVMVENIMTSLSAVTKGNTSVKFVSADVFGNSGNTTTFNVASGIITVINNGANWVNVSLGSGGNSAILQGVVKAAADKGVAIFAAAYPDVVAVTAVNKGQIAPYANMADFVDAAAPGASLVNFNGKTYFTAGTSVATAFATGAAVGMADVNCLGWSEVRPVLLQNLAVPSGGTK